ncbi:hypothetical protein [Hydrogenispora ethanolica]|uniref:hypothetical protein n=1 Tax=Hydrogenispora ethanolica TaxID=1082276 RepID=UPI001405181B|nr:hypothetical protein [Hydrogenispora ethanolica]
MRKIFAMIFFIGLGLQIFELSLIGKSFYGMINFPPPTGIFCIVTSLAHGEILLDSTSSFHENEQPSPASPKHFVGLIC